MGKTFDFIIAGGGSAASVAAMRLVRDFGYSVLILERGPRETAKLMSYPAGYMKYLARDDFLEMHHTVPQPQLGGRGPIVPVAKALGGGSAVNAMVYMRGQREDYDGWAAYLGNEAEWSYADMLPHFKGIEANTRFNNEYHGISGNLRISEPHHISDTTEDFLLAAQGLGHPYNADFNGVRQNGVGIMQHTFGQWNGRTERSDAKKAFLDPLARNERLTIITDARVDKIVIENGRATGVAYVKNGETHTVSVWWSPQPFASSTCSSSWNMPRAASCMPMSRRIRQRRGPCNSSAKRFPLTIPTDACCMTAIASSRNSLIRASATWGCGCSRHRCGLRKPMRSASGLSARCGGSASTF